MDARATISYQTIAGLIGSAWTLNVYRKEGAAKVVQSDDVSAVPLEDKQPPEPLSELPPPGPQAPGPWKPAFKKARAAYVLGWE